MKKWLDLALLCLSIVFIFLGVSECKKSPMQVDVKCNPSNTSMHFTPFSFPPALKGFSYYKSAIIGKLLPQEDINSEKSKSTDQNYNFLLMGTIQIGDKKGAVFYLKKERKCQPYKLGDEIDGWKIADIQGGKVILESGERKEEVRITNEKVSCSRVRITSSGIHQGQIPKAVVLSGPIHKAENRNGVRSSVRRTSKGSLKTPTIPPKKIEKQQKTNSQNTPPPHPVKNPFLEILKKMREKQSFRHNAPVENPFLKLLNKH